MESDQEHLVNTTDTSPHPATRTDSPIRQAYRGKRPDSTPVWFLGQSVLQHPDNWQDLSVREQMDYCLRPEVGVKTALDPVRQFGVDAALCNSDVLFPLRLVGYDLVRKIDPHGEPMRPLRSTADVDRIMALPNPDWSRVETLSRAQRSELAPEKVLIAIAGAPFVLSSLLVEGSVSVPQNLQTRIFMQSQPRNWERLMSWCSSLVRHFLMAQVRGGAEVIQMVDPWVRTLTEGEYACLAESYAREIYNEFDEGIIRISCSLGAEHLLSSISPYVNVLGVGDELTLAEAAQIVPGMVLQGNLDPDLILLGGSDAQAAARQVLDSGLSAPAHVFNVAGRLDPDSDPDEVRRLVDFIHDYRF
ncbi:uroporphyrinogen decarboxylase family protein [Mobiluncus curtisii]|uniref:uroporphyrinogen decarboxylase family protein n=1 Tax=Mobiluncus curtisii TaxID=2051 RepID=UPI00242B03C1|nr:uroporphyrinogen decarboxylase family protein [Mobiluncus curtisii]